jgi:hypothetical protein
MASKYMKWKLIVIKREIHNYGSFQHFFLSES